MNNEMKEIPAFSEFCKNHIWDEIEEYKGVSCYGSELADLLTERMASDGSFTYSRPAAKKYLDKWFADAAEYSDFEEENFGRRSNPFEDVELFLVGMVKAGIGVILSQCDFVARNWNEKFVLTFDAIALIRNQMEELENEGF